MWSARRLSPMAWYLGGEEDNPNMILVGHRQPTENGLLHLVLGKVTTDPTDLTVVVIDSEIWGSSVFTSTPDHTVTSVVRTLQRCHNPVMPIELVYEWGGELLHQKIKLAPNEVLH